MTTTKIRFNPASKEVEIEGSEQFVEKYFQQIKDLFVSFKDSAVETVRPSKRATEKPLMKKSGKRLKKGEIFTSIIDTIKASDRGMSVPDLMKATDFSQQQIRSVVFRAVKSGGIRKAKRGVYIGT